MANLEGLLAAAGYESALVGMSVAPLLVKFLHARVSCNSFFLKFDVYQVCMVRHRVGTYINLTYSSY